MTTHRPPHAPRVAAVFRHTPFDDCDLDRPIPRRFEAQARARPDALAIRTKERSLTYAELNREANRLARAILAADDRDAGAIALLFDHGAAPLVAMLAVLKAGKFYVVLDPAYPPERLSYMLADSAAALVLTEAKHLPLAARLAQGDVRTVVADALEEGLPDDDLAIEPGPDALAMLVYTSGSTGNPKGAMHTHRSVQVEVRNLTNAWCVGAQDRWLLYTSLSFANSVRTIYCALLNGGALFPYDLKRDGFGALPDCLRSNAITILRTLPTTFRNFAATLAPDEVFPDVRLLSIGGEPMYRSDADAFNAHFAPSCTIAHGLGPTECFMVCLNYIAHGARIDAAKLDIGWPLPDKEVLLLDEAGREVAAGEVGEIHVRSRHIALGYWRDAERTAAAFAADPHDPSLRTYRTGDLGVRAADGCLTHVGRRDFQVKIRGYRIDVSEIEVALRAIDGVRDAVVVAREDRQGEKRLIAYFVPSGKPEVIAAEIRRSLFRVVPEYMLPAAFVCLDALPQTPNGKTDRLRLPAPSRERPQLAVACVAPASAVERELHAIWSDILGIDDIGVYDSFFDLGGDSLGAARVVARITQTRGVELPLTAIYETPTIAALAKAIGEEAPRSGDAIPRRAGTRAG